MERFITRRPALILACGLVAGVLAPQALLRATLPAALVAVATCALIAALAIAPPAGPTRVVAAAALALVASFLAGCVRGLPPRGRTVASLVEQRLMTAFTRRPTRLEARIVGVVLTSPARADMVDVDVEITALDTGRLRLPLRGRARLLAPKEAASALAGGGSLAGWVRLRLPDRSRNGPPTADAGFLLARLTSPALLEVEGHPSLVRRLRQRVADGLDRELDDDAFALALALVLGDARRVDPELADGLRATGVVHILSISGLHVALIGALVAGGLLWLRRRPRDAALGAGVAAWAMVLLAAGQPPVIRAACLVTVMAASRWLRRGADPWNALGASACAGAMLHPAEVSGLSFALTHVAAASLLLLVPRVRELLPAGRGVAAHLAREALATSVAAWLGILAFVGTLHRLTPLAPLSNLLAIPVAAVATALSLVAGFAGGMNLPDAGLSQLVLGPCDALLRWLAGWGEWADPCVPAPSALVLAGLVGGLLAWGAARDPRLRAAGALMALVAIYRVGRPRDPGLPEGVAARVTILDVGQGSATLVEIARADASPWRALVDAGTRGERFDAGERRVAPALWAAGIDRLDAVVVSHADLDHRGGMPAVIRRFSPRTVILPRHPRWLAPPWDDLRHECRRGGAMLQAVTAGRRLTPDGAALELRVAWPPRETEALGLVGNDESAVLSVGDASAWAVLIPGDIEARAEGMLARSVRPCAVLVAPHHGSRTSSSRPFLEALEARAVVASAGADNPFGHPHAEAKRRWAALGMTSWVTANDGDVRIDLTSRVASVTTQGSAQVRLYRWARQRPADGGLCLLDLAR